MTTTKTSNPVLFSLHQYSRAWRTIIVFLHDVSVSALALLGAYWLRFNLSIPAEFLTPLWQTSLWMVPLQAVIFIKFGLYRGVWRFASISDLKRILLAIFVATSLVTIVLVMFRPYVMMPRSVLVLDPLLLFIMMGGSRFAYRAWREHRLYGLLQDQGKPVLLLGSDDLATSLIKDLERSRNWRVVGLLNDKMRLHHKQIHGVQILGALDDLADWSTRTGAKHAIIAMPAAHHQDRKRALDLCAEAGVEALTVPSFDDVVSGRVSISQVRKVEVEDLLGRDPVTLDEAGLFNSIGGQVVMVTGAGGSIGSELCRQIVRFNPELLVLFELNEFALYQMEQEFLQNVPRQRIACVIGDVKNATRVAQVLRRYKPAQVFHAAAYKHVPLMEQANVGEALANNVLGTHTLALACKQGGVHKFVLISTDKAVNPTNVMGASKRLAEMVCQGLQESGSTRFVMVRFGNVLGSSGSVIPKFREQIAKGGPVTVTHPEVTRYFMSIPEAAQLVLQAGLMGQGGEIFVLNMGEPIRIAQLAQDMIRLSGFNQDDIKVIYSGLRPGEKLYEELLADDEQTLPTPHLKLRIAQARRVDMAWVTTLLEWVKLSRDADESLIKRQLQSWLSEYVGDVNALLDSGAARPEAEEPEPSLQE